jgi:phage tail sheath gpL-like
MGNPITIVGWASTNKVPGVGGETIYGAGPLSAQSVPLLLLLVGTKLTAGTAVANQDVVDIRSSDDADAAFGAGAELSLMCYAALLTTGVSIKAAPVAEAGGAVASTLTITITGPATSSGTWFYRLNGKVYTGGISNGDSATTIAAAISAAINADTRAAFTAAPVAGVVTVTVKSKGARGNQHVCFQDTTKLATGATSVLAGGTALTGGLVPFSGGTGTETNTALLGVLLPSQYHRIGSAESDATNLAAWKTQLDAQAGPTANILQHYVFATSGSLAAHQSLTQTTLNHPRFQGKWYLNSESHPCQIAASFASLRTATEQGDPDAAYDDAIIPGIAPQSQKADWPSYATNVAALNTGVSPVYTSSDGYAKVVRSIQTRSLNGASPDYRVLDTSDAYVPDFIRADLSLDWSTSFRVANPRNADDAADGKPPVAGVGTPSTWNARVEGKLRRYERGEGFPAPIIINVDNNKPASAYDAIGKRIMTAVPVVPAPNTHQVGISIRQQGG